MKFQYNNIFLNLEEKQQIPPYQRLAPLEPEDTQCLKSLIGGQGGCQKCFNNTPIFPPYYAKAS